MQPIMKCSSVENNVDIFCFNYLPSAFDTTRVTSVLTKLTVKMNTNYGNEKHQHKIRNLIRLL